MAAGGGDGSGAVVDAIGSSGSGISSSSSGAATNSSPAGSHASLQLLGGAGGGGAPPPAGAEQQHQQTTATATTTPTPTPTPPTTGAFVSAGFSRAALVDALRYPLKAELRLDVQTACGPQRAEALRAAFALPPGQVLLGHFLCARRKAGIYLQGQLFVFGGCLVFQSNVFGAVKFKTIWFENGALRARQQRREWERFACL